MFELPKDTSFFVPYTRFDYNSGNLPVVLKEHPFDPLPVDNGIDPVEKRIGMTSLINEVIRKLLG